MRFLSVTGFILLLSVIFSSCEKNTNTNPIPSISFKSFTAYSRDSAVLQVNFTDGDGDIGYASQDASAPFNFYIQYWYSTDSLAPSIAQFPADTVFRPDININVTPHDTLGGQYHIPDITQPGNNKALSGIIQIALTGDPDNNGWYHTYCSLNPSHTYFEYKIWLFDRAGHKSNVITTPIEQGL